MENKTRNNIIRVLHKKMGEIHELLDTIDNCDIAECDEPGYTWCESHPERRICHYHATAGHEHECYFCPECAADPDPGLSGQDEAEPESESECAINNDITRPPGVDASLDILIGDYATTGLSTPLMYARIRDGKRYRVIVKPLEDSDADKKINARDALAYLVDEYHTDTAHQSDPDERVYQHEQSATQYEVVVRRKAVVAKNATADHFVDVNKMVASAVPDSEPVGWANRYRVGWSYIHSTDTRARKAADVPDIIEIAVPLYRHPASEVHVDD